MPSRRRQREDELLNPPNSGFWSYTPFYPALLQCAFEELVAALNDRKRGALRDRDDHLTEHAVGSIALLVDGLEAWLNHVIFLSSSHTEIADGENPREMAFGTTKEKYAALSKHITGTKMSIPQSLDLTIEVRNQIVHHLPRKRMAGGSSVPSWFDGLESKGLFTTSKRIQPDLSDFGFGQKLQSYSLAYWAWESVDESITKLITPWPSYVGGWIKDTGTENFYFERYKSVCPPKSLPQLDARHSLKNDDPAYFDNDTPA